MSVFPSGPLFLFCVHVFRVQNYPPAAFTPHPLHPQCDYYLAVMDKVVVLAVEVVSPGH